MAIFPLGVELNLVKCLQRFCFVSPGASVRLYLSVEESDVFKIKDNDDDDDDDDDFLISR